MIMPAVAWSVSTSEVGRKFVATKAVHLSSCMGIGFMHEAVGYFYFQAANMC